MRSPCVLKQPDLFPQPPPHCSPWQAAPGWDLMLCRPVELACCLLCAHCTSPSPSLERASSNVGLPDSFLPGEDDGVLSLLSTSWVCVWVPVSHTFQSWSPWGSGCFLISLCDTVKMHCPWPIFENEANFLSQSTSFQMPSLYIAVLLVLSTHHEPHHMPTCVKGYFLCIIQPFFSFTLPSGTKWTSLQTPDCSGDKLLLLWSTFSSRHPI